MRTGEVPRGRSGCVEAIMAGFWHWINDLSSHKTAGRLSRANRSRRQRRNLAATNIAVEGLEDRLLLTFDIVLNYTYDSGGFFNSQARRNILENVATVFESRITDDLAAITPSGVNNWTAVLNNPSTGTQVNIQNLSVPADTVIVYVGARNLTSGLGLGGPAGFNSVATPAFNQLLETRGESGVNTSGTNDTDFAPWGGTIAFDSLVSWNFSLDPPSAGQNDFYSVALHEMAHVLGFGTSDAFRNLIDASTNRFTGAQTVTAFGGPVPMHSDSLGNPDAGHFASGTTGTLPGTNTTQETAMDPQVTTGSRKQLTDVDWAALNDLGWDVSPVADSVDYGDAPDAASGTATGNYNTRAADNGPSHTIVANLFIGAQPDGDDGSLQNPTASADDMAGTSDESFTGSGSLTAVAGVANSITVNVTNSTGTAGTLYGWIDFDQNGVFSAAERAMAAVPSGTVNGLIALNFPANTLNPPTAVSSFARFRLSTDTAAAQPTGAATNGEVEDHPITIAPQTAAFDTLPNFTWPATAAAVRYELEVNNVSTSTTRIIHQTQLTKTNFRPPAALTPGTYSWRYRPHSSTAALPWSPLQQFMISEKIGSPLVTDPVAFDATTGAASLPTIAWSAVQDATSYYLWVDDLTNVVSRVIYQLDLTATSFTPSTALTAGDYRAWVRPIGDTGALSGWSTPLDFTVSAASTTAGEVTSPVGSSTNAAPTMAWRPTGSSNQRLIVTNTATSAVVLDVSGIEGLSYTPPQGLPAGSYAARIEVGGVPAAGGSGTFQIETVAGGAELTRTSNYESDPVPTFGWTAVNGATRYDLWVDDVSNSVTRLLYSNTITGTAYQATRALAPGVYRAWVRAYNNFTPTGNWSTPLTFRVTTATTVPTIAAPINTTLNTLPTVAWSAVGNATSYSVTVIQGGATIQQYTTSDNWKTLDSVLPPGAYEVQVTAIGTGLTAASADTATFTVGTTTGTLQLFGTSGTITNTRPTFTWPIIDGASRYVIWVNDDTRSLVATVFDSEISTTSYTPVDALQPGNHRVWIRAFDASGALTPWSAASPFVVAETVGAPSITAPAATINSPIPDITWTAVTGAASYEVEVLNPLTGNSVAYTSAGITTTVHRPTSALAAGAYDIHVRSVDSGGAPSAWSELRRLNITPIAASDQTQLVTPLFNSTIDNTNTLFAWTFVDPVSSATYDLWVSNLTTATRPVFEQGLTANSFVAANLPAGDYRAWVRVVGAGFGNTWSFGQEFTVAAVTQNTLDDNGKLSTLLVALNLDVDSKDVDRRFERRRQDDRHQEDGSTEELMDAVWTDPAAVLPEMFFTRRSQSRREPQS